MRLLRSKQHISGRSAAAAAIGGMEVPISAPNIVLGRKAEGAGNAIDRSRSALDLKEHAHRCFIQVQMEAGEAERCPVLFVAEAGAQAKRA